MFFFGGAAAVVHGQHHSGGAMWLASWQDRWPASCGARQVDEGRGNGAGQLGRWVACQPEALISVVTRVLNVSVLDATLSC